MSFLVGIICLYFHDPRFKFDQCLPSSTSFLLSILFYRCTFLCFSCKCPQIPLIILPNAVLVCEHVRGYEGLVIIGKKTRVVIGDLARSFGCYGKSGHDCFNIAAVKTMRDLPYYYLDLDILSFFISHHISIVNFLVGIFGRAFVYDFFFDPISL